MSTYTATDIYEDVWIYCDEHPDFRKKLSKGASMVEVLDVVKAHNEHAKDTGCGSVLVPAKGKEPQ